MDAIYGIGTHWEGDLVSAVDRVALDILKSRQKYGALSSPDYGKWREDRMMAGAS
jgi:hypothetical protein